MRARARDRPIRFSKSVISANATHIHRQIHTHAGVLSAPAAAIEGFPSWKRARLLIDEQPLVVADHNGAERDCCKFIAQRANLSRSVNRDPNAIHQTAKSECKVEILGGGYREEKRRRRDISRSGAARMRREREGEREEGRW